MPYLFNLQWFAEGGGTAPSGNAAEAEQETVNNEVGSQEKQTVLYGKQPMPPKGEQEGESSSEQFSYKQLKEQFKDEYQADLQRIINKRFKNSSRVKEERDLLKEQLHSYEGVLTALESQYGTRDPEQLLQRLNSDDKRLEEEALEAGMELNSYKEYKSAKMQAQKLQSELDGLTRAQQQQQLIEQWQKEAVELKEIYPDFILEDEVENEKFAMALQSGMSMKDSFQYAHFDEILSGAIQYTAESVKKAVSDAQAQRKQRPTENGVRGGAAAIVKNDVSKLTREDMEEIDRLVLRGERISF